MLTVDNDAVFVVADAETDNLLAHRWNDMLLARMHFGMIPTFVIRMDIRLLKCLMLCHMTHIQSDYLVCHPTSIAKNLFNRVCVCFFYMNRSGMCFSGTCASVFRYPPLSMQAVNKIWRSLFRWVGENVNGRCREEK